MARISEPDHPLLNQTVRAIYFDPNGVEVPVRGVLEKDLTGKSTYRISVLNPGKKGADAFTTHRFDRMKSCVLDRHDNPPDQAVVEY